MCYKYWKILSLTDYARIHSIKTNLRRNTAIFHPDLEPIFVPIFRGKNVKISKRHEIRIRSQIEKIQDVRAYVLIVSKLPSLSLISLTARSLYASKCQNKSVSFKAHLSFQAIIDAIQTLLGRNLKSRNPTISLFYFFQPNLHSLYCIGYTA